MSKTKTQAAKFTPQGGKACEVVTMADLRQAVWRVTQRYGSIAIVNGDVVYQAGDVVGRIDGEVSGE